MAEHNDLGKWGEEEAAHFLEHKGYEIVERDWKVGKRDLDIIAIDGVKKTLVFVEVKTRCSDDYQAPEEAVDVKKMRNLAVAANAYIKRNALVSPVRFDIISVIGSNHHVESIEHIEDAFNPLLIL